MEDFSEYINDQEALEQRKLARMKKRETKLNLIQDELENEHVEDGEDIVDGSHSTRSSKKHHIMRNAKSVIYKSGVPNGRSKEKDSDIMKEENSKKLFLNEPLEIFVDGPFGSPSRLDFNNLR